MNFILKHKFYLRVSQPLMTSNLQWHFHLLRSLRRHLLHLSLIAITEAWDSMCILVNKAHFGLSIRSLDLRRAIHINMSMINIAKCGLNLFTSTDPKSIWLSVSIKSHGCFLWSLVIKLISTSQMFMPKSQSFINI